MTLQPMVSSRQYFRSVPQASRFNGLHSCRPSRAFTTRVAAPQTDGSSNGSNHSLPAGGTGNGSLSLPLVHRHQPMIPPPSSVPVTSQPAAAIAAQVSPVASHGHPTSAAGVPPQPYTAMQPSADALLQMQMQMQLQMQQQMQQMSALLQATQQQNVMLWQQMQQLQQQLEVPAATEAAANKQTPVESMVANSTPSMELPDAAAEITQVAQATPAVAAVSELAADAPIQTRETAPATASMAAAPPADWLPANRSAAAATSNPAQHLPRMTPIPGPAAAQASAPVAAAPAAAITKAKSRPTSTSTARPAASTAAVSTPSADAAAVQEARQQLAAATAVAKAAAATGNSTATKPTTRQSAAAETSKLPKAASGVDVKQQLQKLQQMNQVMAQAIQVQQQKMQQQQSSSSEEQQQHLEYISADTDAAKGTAGKAESAAAVNEAVSEAVNEQTNDAATAVEQQQQQPPPVLAISVSPEVAAAAAVALQELKQTTQKQQEQQQRASALASAAAAAVSTANSAASNNSSSNSTNSRQSQCQPTKGGSHSSSSSSAASRPDALLNRISSSRSLRELQMLFERQQQRLRPHHLAALVARLPETVEGQIAVREQAAAAAAPAPNGATAINAPNIKSSGISTSAAGSEFSGSSNSVSSLTSSSVAVTSFAGDLLTMLQLQLGQLQSTRLLGVVQAAAALLIRPRPAWISSFLAASQSKLQYLTPTQLADLAVAVAFVTTAVPHVPAAAERPAGQSGAGQVSGFWLRSWLACSMQHFQKLAEELQQQRQQHQQGVTSTMSIKTNATAAAVGQADGAAECKGTVAAAAAIAQQPPAAAVGKLAVAAIQLGALATPPAAAAATGSSSSKGGPGPTLPERVQWTAALLATATAATEVASAVAARAPAAEAPVAADENNDSVKSEPTAFATAPQVLDAATAADIAYCLTYIQQQEPVLLQQQGQGGLSRADLSQALAAVAAAAIGSVTGSSSKVLMRLVKGVMAAEVLPDPLWLDEMAAALQQQVTQLSAAESLTIVEAFSMWYSVPYCDQQQQHHGKQQQQQQQGLHDRMQGLLGSLLVQAASVANSFNPQQMCYMLSTVTAQLGFKATNPSHEAAVQQLFATLSTTESLTSINLAQLIQLLQALQGFGVTPTQGFVSAVQHEGLRARLSNLKPQEFAAAAQSLAGLRNQMDREVLDGYWMELEMNLTQLTDNDIVALLCALGSLKQKPRAQYLGAFMAAALPRLQKLSLRQLVDCLQALAALKLERADTQGIRATTALAAPAPSDVVQELLKHLTPQLSGSTGASAAELSTVLSALAALGYSPDKPWLDKALDGAVEKIQIAVACLGGEQVLVNFLKALSQLSVKASEDVLAEAVRQLQLVGDKLSASQIAGAMAALKRLNLHADNQLMGSYLDRTAAAAATGAATAKDMASVLHNLAVAGVVPPSNWLASYLEAVRQSLKVANSADLAAICYAAATLATAVNDAAAASGSSRSAIYTPNQGFISDLVAVAVTRLGSTYMDAARILNTADYRAPLNLSCLADTCWGLLKLGASSAGVQPIVTMLVNKSYDRFSQLTVQQLAATAWAIAYCSSSSSSNGRSSSTSIKLPAKWLNQFAIAAAPSVLDLTQAQLSDLIWALGRLYLGAESYSTDGLGSTSSSNNSTSSTTSDQSVSGSAAASSGSIGSSSAAPVQQLLRAVSCQLDAQLLQQQQQGTDSTAPATGQTSAADVSVLINLLTKFDCSASRHLLQRYCTDVASSWGSLPDAAVADAAVAIAVLIGPGRRGSSSSSSGSSSGNSSIVIPAGWLEQLSEQVVSRLSSLLPWQRCRCIWALATLKHNPSISWLQQFAAETFNPSTTSQLQPGDLSDAVWAVYTLEQLTQQHSSNASAAEQVASASSTTDSSASGNGSSLLTESLMQLTAQKITKRVNELSAPQVLRLLLLAEGALTKLPDYRLPKGVADQLGQVLSARAAVVAESTGVVHLLWAAARLQLHLHITTLDQFCKRVYAGLPTLSATDMAHAFWASEKLGYRWLLPQLKAFDRQSGLKLSDMSGTDVALMLETFKAHKYSPSPEWLKAFAGMPAASLAQLSCDEALQLAVRLADSTVGLPAREITWLTGWAERLTSGQLQSWTGRQLCSVVQLLADASIDATAPSSKRKAPSSRLLGLLCLTLVNHISSCSGQEVYCLVKALAEWQYLPPNGNILLAAAAMRLADKLPVLSDLQAVEVLCSFAQLGFTVPEPLQSRLCDKLVQGTVGRSIGSTRSSSTASSAALEQANSTASILASVLLALPNPRPSLVESLMQHLQSSILLVAPNILLQLGQGLIAAGMQARPAAAAAPGDTQLSVPELWGKQYLAASAKAMRMLPLPDLAAMCRVLLKLGLPADAAAAEAAIVALQPYVTGAATNNSRRGASGGDVAAVVGFVTDSGFRPNAEVMAAVELLLQQLLRPDSSSSSSGVAADMIQDPVPGQQQQLTPEDLARLLLNMNKWGRRPSSSFSAAAYDWSRHHMVDTDTAILGPLLLGLTIVCGKPPAAWLVDWCAVTVGRFDRMHQAVNQNFDKVKPDDLTAIGAAAAEGAGSIDKLSNTWMEQYSLAVLQQLPILTEQQLENICSSLYRLRFSPSRQWVAAVSADLQRRAPATDTPAACALAYVKQLKVSD